MPGIKSNKYYDFLIYASNVTGLGASQVAHSLVEALLKTIGPRNTAIIIPEKSIWASAIQPNHYLSIVKYRRHLPHQVSRFAEVIFPKEGIRAKNIINLGDLPLRIKGNQAVLVHQPHLISPKISKGSSASFSYRLMRILMRLNCHYAKTIIVQSEVFKRQLSETFPGLSQKISVIPQPAPKWLYQQRPGKKDIQSQKHKITLFYPAAGYSHKNHSLLLKITDSKIFQERVGKIITTRTSHSWIDEKSKAYIDNRGRLSPSEMLQAYAEADALFFPSYSESYGLPLLEAMILGLPIICSDRSYAHWMCDGHAEYFDPDDGASALKAIDKTFQKLQSGVLIDWQNQLEKFPQSWNEVAIKFLSHFKC
jgi:glycosyltransferase involved in cell wall biosynthesis